MTHHNAMLFRTFLAAITLAGASHTSSAAEDPEERVPTHYAAIVCVDSEEAVSDLETAGVEILRRRENLLLCYIPVGSDIDAEDGGDSDRRSRSIRSLRRTPGVKYAEPGRMVAPAMDIAREWQHASDIHSGNGLPTPYTGNGVVTGLCDIGFDPGHINFYDSDGHSRIARITQYRERFGERFVLDSEKDYIKWATDTVKKDHATHVAGIMAGSYGPSGYSGMAPDAEIVASTSQLYDVGLLCGAEDILDYAREQGKPAVINMSMGNYTGPHDGTSLFSQYLDMIGEEAIVVLSAGNGGAYTNSLDFDFTEDNRNLRFEIHNYQWTQFDMYGETDIWSASDAPIKCRVMIRDSQEDLLVAEFPWQDFSTEEPFMVSSSGDGADPEFAKYFDGELSMRARIDPFNGRFNILAEYDAHTEAVSSLGPWARYTFVFELEADPGTHADVYTDGVYTRLSGSAGYPAPGSKLSFSDLSSGYNLISVGMYTNRTETPSLSGEGFSFKGVAGTVNDYSSYATLIDGRVMPLTVAPGANVVSSFSGPYLAANPEEISRAVAKSDVEDKSYYWMSCSGTSMSAPYVAGVVACWLEANPALGIKDVQHIIHETNLHNYPDPENPRHGQGWFNPVDGLRMAIDISSVYDGIPAEYKAPRISFSGSVLTLWNPGGHNRTLTVSDVSGRIAATVRTSDPTADLDLSQLPSGIYIASCEGVSIKFKK